MRFASFFYKNFPRLTFFACKIAKENYEKEMTLLNVLCDKKKASVDIGAKMGMYTYRILGHSNSVVAFEPIPRFNKMLTRVFDGRPCRIEPKALSNKPGEMVMRLPFYKNGQPMYGRSTIHENNQLEFEKIAEIKEMKVEVSTLDSYEFDNLGFIKIDVEGHENEVLEGAASTIEKHHPNMLIESNEEHSPGAVSRLASWLDGKGYKAAFVSGSDLIDIGDFDRNKHPDIENFICFHESNLETRSVLAERLPL